MISAKLNGLDLVMARLRKLPVQTTLGVERALVEAGMRVQATAKRSIQNSPADAKTGRSKPGNPPKTDTGRGVNSIFLDNRTDKNGAKVYVGTNVDYMAMLEFGTTQVAARPWLQPALEANKRTNEREIALAVKRAVEESKR